MFIYVGCAGGGTSSMFCQRMVKEIQQHDENLRAAFADVQSIAKHAAAYSGAYDLVFAYGGAGEIREYTAFEFGNLFDVVYIAPQVRFMTPALRQLLAPYPTLVRDIPMRIFGNMEASKAYPQLLDELIILDEERAAQSGHKKASKGWDKNIELLILGQASTSRLMGEFSDYLSRWDIRTIKQRFSIPVLYQEPEADFDLRLLFGRQEELTEDLPKIARRIDGVVLFPGINGLSPTISQWLKAYHIPIFIADLEVLGESNPEPQFDDWLTFLLEVQVHTEYRSEIQVAALEVSPMPKRKSFLGIFSWEVAEKAAKK